MMTRAQGHLREDCAQGWIKHSQGLCGGSVITVWMLCQTSVPNFDVEESQKPGRAVFVPGRRSVYTVIGAVS